MKINYFKIASIFLIAVICVEVIFISEQNKRLDLNTIGINISLSEKELDGFTDNVNPITLCNQYRECVVIANLNKIGGGLK